MSNLNQGVKKQIFRTNDFHLSFLIAYSAFSRLYAKLNAFSWANLSFNAGPYTEKVLKLDRLLSSRETAIYEAPGEDTMEANKKRVAQSIAKTFTRWFDKVSENADDRLCRLETSAEAEELLEY